MFLGVGLLLLVVVMGFVVFYSRGTNIDVGKVVSSSNSLQSEVIHDQIMCAKKDLGEVMMELGVKSCQNQAGIIKGVLKLENRVSSGILDSSSERAEILESVTGLDDRLASYVSTSSLEQALVLEKVAKLDNRLTEHLLNSSVGNAGILEKVIKVNTPYQCPLRGAIGSSLDQAMMAMAGQQEAVMNNQVAGAPPPMGGPV
jgi:hypothetical protein